MQVFVGCVFVPVYLFLSDIGQILHLVSLTFMNHVNFVNHGQGGNLLDRQHVPIFCMMSCNFLPKCSTKSNTTYHEPQ